MPALFWVDAAALVVSAVLASALAVAALGSDPRRSLNRFFALFALLEALWAALSVVLRVSLWLGRGDAMLLVQLVTLSYVLLCIAMFCFAVRYAGSRTLWSDLAALGGLGVLGALLPALFSGAIVTRVTLWPNGSAVSQYTSLGYASAVLPAGFVLAALVLLWRRRSRAGAPNLAVSVLLFFSGLVFGAVLELSLPALSVATTASLLLMSYGLIRRQLLNPLRERAARLELLSRVGRSVATRRVQEVLRESVQRVCDTFGFHNVAVLLRDGDWLVLRAASLPEAHPLEGSLRLRVGAEGISGWVAEHGTPVRIGDVRRDPRYVARLPGARTRSEMAVPIRLKDRVVGVLDAQSSEPEGFDEEDQFTLQTVADQLAVALENARLYDEARRRAERLEVVNRVATAAGATLRLEDLVEAVYKEIVPVFSPDACFVALYDAETQELDFRLQVDRGAREPPSRSPLGTGLTSWVVQHQRPLRVDDLRRPPPGLPVPELYGTMEMPAAWLGVPMRRGPRVEGVLCVQSYRPGAYGEEEQLLLSTIAEQVAQAVQLVRLYETAQSELIERRRAEEVLRESEEQFRNLAEQSPNMIFINAGGPVVYANRMCEEITGYSRQEFYAPGFDYRVLIAPEHRQRLEANFRRHLAGEDLSPYEYVLLCKDGRRLDVIISSRLIGYRGRQALLGIVTDISSRTRTERLLLTLNSANLAMEQALGPEEIFATAARELRRTGCTMAVFLLDRSGGALRAAHLDFEQERLDGVRDLLRMPAGSLTLPAEASEALRQVASTRQAVFIPDAGHFGGQHPRETTEALRRAAEILGIRRSVVCPLWPGAEPIGLLSVHSDELTEADLPALTAFANQMAAAWSKARLLEDLRRSLQDLQSTQAQLLHSQKMEAIGKLAGGVAHDFNNLLTAIKGYTDLLLRRVGAEDPMRGDLEEIRVAAERAARLTRQLLSFSRRQVLQPRLLDLSEIVSHMEDMLHRLIGEHIRLVTELAQQPAPVEADPGQVEQLILNLVVNARDAMPSGGTVTISTADLLVPEGEPPPVSGLRPGRHVLLRVRDTGSGMDAETRSHIFEPFFTTKEQGQGTGLGLFTVYGIVSQSEGVIDVHSEPGRGSVFSVYLPVASGEAAAEAPRRQAPAVLQGRETLLVVEDESVVRELVARVLRGYGYTVLEAGSGAEALRIAESSEQDIALMVTDLVMPGGISGRELAERLAPTRPRMQVLYISGYADESQLPEGMDLGGSGFLSKPFVPEALAGRVRELLENQEG